MYLSGGYKAEGSRAGGAWVDAAAERAEYDDSSAAGA